MGRTNRKARHTQPIKDFAGLNEAAKPFFEPQAYEKFREMQMMKSQKPSPTPVYDFVEEKVPEPNKRKWRGAVVGALVTATLVLTLVAVWAAHLAWVYHAGH